MSAKLKSQRQIKRCFLNLKIKPEEPHDFKPMPQLLEPDKFYCAWGRYDCISQLRNLYL